MKRKISTVPSRVYRYRLYAPQGDMAERVAESFDGSRLHYNKLITIENRRRALYRQARSRLFPKLASLEARYAEVNARIQGIREAVQAAKVKSRSRVVDPAMRAEIAVLKASKKPLLDELRRVRAICAKSPELLAEAKQIDGAANAEIKALRPETYWGTYLLVEAAAKQAAKQSKGDPKYDLTPPYRCKSRIGVHFCPGISPTGLKSSRLMRFEPAKFRLNNHDEEIATGKAARTTLQFRIGSNDDRSPVWATLPMVQHRPIPTDARIKDAFITRRRFTVRIPWEYHLCVVLESPSFQSPRALPEQQGSSAVNFGWRSTRNGIRVAMIHRQNKETEEILLPPYYLALETKRRELASILDAKFNEAKARLSGWIAEHDCPEEFREVFARLGNRKSQHWFAEWMDYWQEHRFPGDDEIFAALAAREDPNARRGAKPWAREDIAKASWMVRYRHLRTWHDSLRRKFDNWRDYFYRCVAKKLVTETASLVIEAFDMRKVARRPVAEEPEDQGDERARSNRQLASASDLRLKILQAAVKYHCLIEIVKPENNTRRCYECGELYAWDPKIAIMHTCPGCGARWDQDVNNTNRQQARVASGEVVPFVTPAQIYENTDGSPTIVPARLSTFAAARKSLSKIAEP